jgi:hypothetical protein
VVLHDRIYVDFTDLLIVIEFTKRYRHQTQQGQIRISKKVFNLNGENAKSDISGFLNIFMQKD